MFKNLSKSLDISFYHNLLNNDNKGTSSTVASTCIPFKFISLNLRRKLHIIKNNQIRTLKI